VSIDYETRPQGGSRLDNGVTRVRVIATPQARRFAVSYVVLVTFLNIFAVVRNAYSLANVFATLALIVAMYPMYRWLKDKRETELLPFFPIVSLIYALYYGFSLFVPYDVYITYIGLPQQYITEASLLSFLGVAILVGSYYLWPARIRIKEIPPLSMYWSERRARVAALGFGVIGIGATVPIIAGYSGVAQQLVYFASNLSFVAIAILFYLQLHRRLSTGYLVVLWGALIPLTILVNLSSGSTWPAIRLIVLLFMLYLAAKRAVPWRMVVAGSAIVLILVPVLALKHDYRATYGFGEELRVSSFEDALQGGTVFAGIVGESVAQQGFQMYRTSADVVVNRLDLIQVVAYVLMRTPETVPFLKGESYSDALWKFVPSFIYPNKPDPNWGQLFGHRYELISPTDYVTSVNMPQMIEMYVNFGIPGLFIGMFLLAQLYRFLSYLLNHTGAGEWITISGAVIFANLANIESNFLLIFGGIVQWIVLLYLLGFLVRRRINHQPYRNRKLT
jgi:hypothetical protein